MQHRTEIAAIVSKLMAHYWLPDEPTRMREMAGSDWLEDLEEFPLKVIAQACTGWRRGDKRKIRPMPGDIRALCIEACSERVASQQAALEDQRSPGYKLRKLEDCRSLEDKRAYYAEAYAWMIHRGFLAADATSCRIDPQGEWYDHDLVEHYLGRIRRHDASLKHRREEHESRDEVIQAQNQKYARAAAWRAGKLAEYDAGHYRPPNNSAAEGRALCNEWAREQGYAGFDDAFAAGRKYAEVIAWNLAKASQMPLHPAERMSASGKERLRKESLRPYSTPDRSPGDVLRDMGITSSEAAK